MRTESVIRTNIVIDDQLMADALKATGLNNKKKAVGEGLSLRSDKGIFSVVENLGLSAVVKETQRYRKRRATCCESSTPCVRFLAALLGIRAIPKIQQLGVLPAPVAICRTLLIWATASLNSSRQHTKAVR